GRLLDRQVGAPNVFGDIRLDCPQPRGAHPAVLSKLDRVARRAKRERNEPSRDRGSWQKIARLRSKSNFGALKGETGYCARTDRTRTHCLLGIKEQANGKAPIFSQKGFARR